MKFGYYIAFPEENGWGTMPDHFSSEAEAINAAAASLAAEKLTVIHVKPIASFVRSVHVRMLS